MSNSTSGTMQVGDPVIETFPRCPSCKSPDIRVVKTVYLGITAGNMDGPAYRECQSCKHRWGIE